VWAQACKLKVMDGISIMRELAIERQPASCQMMQPRWIEAQRSLN
jgi:hypothetical protein